MTVITSRKKRNTTKQVKHTQPYIVTQSFFLFVAMKCEIESAANFLSSMLKLHSNVLTSEQLERFKDAIETHLQNQYQHHWFPDRPTKGSGYRCIRINHKLDPILSKAGQSCGIDSNRLSTIFPNELTLWVDPQEVSYRIGENGSICVLFDGRTGDANSNIGSSDHKNSPSNKQQNQHHINDAGKGHRSVISVNRHHQHQQQIRSAGTGRFSPTDSTLSSSTSTMSSPSPSSSPDWCRMSYDRHSSPENWVKNQGTMVQMNGGAFTDHHPHHQHTSMHHQVQQQHTLTNGHHTANIRRSSPISVMGFGSPSANGGMNGSGGGPSSLEGVSLYNGFHHSNGPPAAMPFAFNHGVVNGNTVGVGTGGNGTNVNAVLRNGANVGHNTPMAGQQSANSVSATGPNQSGHFNAAFTNGWGSPSLFRG